LNPYVTIAIQKKSLKKVRGELKQSQLEIKEIKKELAWEKSRSEIFIKAKLPFLLKQLKKEIEGK